MENTANETALCAGCLRDNEEERADLWCNDCSEPVCRACGKAHRRFASPHDVMNIQDVSKISRCFPKNCMLHPEQKLIFFCSKHDKIICRVCLSKNHKECEIITEIETAAHGIKDTLSITDLKCQIATLKNTADSVRRKCDTRLTTVSDEKQKADNHLQRIRECVNSHFTRIETKLSTVYDEIVRETSDDSKHVEELATALQNYYDEIESIVQKSSEVHLFQIVKYLQTTQISEKCKMKEIEEKVHRPLDTLPDEFEQSVDDMFEKVQERKANTDTEVDTDSEVGFQESQVNIEKKSSLPEKTRIINAENDREFGACCFTEDNHLVVYAFKRNSHGYVVNGCLSVYDEDCISRSVPLCYDVFSVCMYDKSNALVTTQNERSSIVVVNISHLQVGRKINLKCDIEKYGSPIKCTEIFCCKGNIWTLVQFRKEFFSWGICTVDFNGNILKSVHLPDDVCDICYDGNKKFYMTHYKRNDVTYTTNLLIEYVVHSSLDLREGCRMSISGNHILLLDKGSNIVYSLNIETKSRGVEQRNEITDPSHFCFNAKTKQLAVTMDYGKCIKLFKTQIP